MTQIQKFNTFQKSMTGKSTYVCECCGKRTRETGEGESYLTLCAYCYIEAGLENSLSDGHMEQDEFDRRIAELKKRYNRQ
jgi:hypothetical protein